MCPFSKSLNACFASLCSNFLIPFIIKRSEVAGIFVNEFRTNLSMNLYSSEVIFKPSASVLINPSSS